jgi:hypothetical protein
MPYQAFLHLITQLAGSKKARVVLQGNVIFFETSNIKNQFTLSTKVYSGDGRLSPHVCSCVSSNGTLRWQQGGAYLKLDPITHSVYLIEDVEMEEGKYIPFRDRLSDFSSVAEEWKEILQNLSETDRTSPHVF